MIVPINAVVAASTNLAAHLAALGIHIGYGHPARCVVCDTPWPCVEVDEDVPPCEIDG